MDAAPAAMRVLEFYSGLGGLHYAAMQALPPGGRVVQAFDINDTANDVYQHNFGRRPYQGNIEALTCRQLDAYAADMWLLSPPCQPYSRQGHQKQSRDARAASFITLLSKLPQLAKQPRYLLLENVVGFETSDTHADMLNTLHAAGYITIGFILSPHLYGFPYSRPRYFCLAKKGKFACSPAPLPSPAATTPSTATNTPAAQGVQGSDGPSEAHVQGSSSSVTPSSHVLLHEPPYVLLDKARGGPGALKDVPPLGHFLLQHPCPTADVMPTQQPPSQPPSQSAGPAQPSAMAAETYPLAQAGQAGSSCEGVLGGLVLVPPNAADGVATAGSEGPGKGSQQGPGTAQQPTTTTIITSSQQGEIPTSHMSHKRQLPDPPVGTLDSPQDHTLDGPCSKRTQQGVTLQGVEAAGPSCHVDHMEQQHVGHMGPHDDHMEQETVTALSCWSDFMVPDKLLLQCGDVLDVVTAKSHRCKTFTKNYRQYIKGTGSVVCMASEYQDPQLCTREAVQQRAAALQALAPGSETGNATACGDPHPESTASGNVTALAGDQGLPEQVLTGAPPAAADADEDEDHVGAARSVSGPGHPLAPLLDKQLMAAEWRRMALRFATPREVASLHALPASFSFPARVTLRARYQLLGNSLNVAVLADLIAFLLVDGE